MLGALIQLVSAGGAGILIGIHLFFYILFSLQYDTLYIDKKCYKYNPVEGRVVEHTVNILIQ